ncbi:HDL507Cp [Eremothecium sinecaudum]|uniref:HDL507Cp n=1 Tax=Eremothecium sinecaudum TaxID=45286 RepID=A0A120K229_9SACH|nr:HDL507Cp [Eremothecium sinecaudum]AMD20237.1 HDL507Cp [Eremothecium sinecaudum]
MSQSVKKDSSYWKDRKNAFILDVDCKVAKERDYEDTYTRFKYLLELTDLFRHFIGMRAKHDKNMRKLLKQIDGEGRGKSGRTLRHRESSRHYRKTEKEEDEELMQDEESTLPDTTVITESPSYIKSGKLRDYQIYGLNWLVSLHGNKLSGILADEMGLGKTLQTIAFLGYLRYVKGIEGPYLVVVPKSTLDNWQREFAKWTPEVNTLALQGDKETRGAIIDERIMKCDFDVIITTYEMVIKEKSALKKFAWQYIIIDEAHRIKNEQSTLSQIIRLFYSKNRLLITGTPLQNNLHELWALLNFLLPDVFGESEVFDEWFQQNENDQDQDVVVQQLHAVLQPFLLRRLKSEVEKSLLPKIETNVYVGMSDMQIHWYKSLLEKDIDAVNGAVGKREGKTRLLNIVMQLRKCCNHPYLFEGAEPGPPFTTDEHLIFNSGKMIILDKLLERKHQQGSRVLIFSQMSRLLDILEDYCYFRGYEYCRIDGSTSHEDRITAIDEYNAPQSDKFIFLLTTRAGGLGINLVTADTVVLYDSDWNPQADLQAMDRAHRIGQKKQVHVYRFVTENAIEEKVIERAAQKLRLDQLVIQQGIGKKSASLGNTSDELIDMIQFGAKNVFEHISKTVTMDEDIDDILKKGEQKTKQLNARYEALGLDDLQKFNGMTDQSKYDWNGTNFEKRKSNDKTLDWINPSRRERRRDQTYSVDDYYKEIIGGASSKGSTKGANQPRMPRPPKFVQVQDFQFPPPELSVLQEREQLSYKKKINYKVSSYDLGSDVEDDADGVSERVSAEQAKIDECPEFTEEDELAKQKLIKEAFTNWTKREFVTFISGCAKYGRKNYKAIANTLENKTLSEVEKYGNAFWDRYTEIQGYEKYLNTIENGEKKTEKLRQQELLLCMKISQCESPLHEMVIQYPPNNARRTYNSIEDKFILLTVNKYGLFYEHLYEKLKQDIMTSSLFHFDWFIRTRTVHDLSKRVNTLLTMITREYEGQDVNKRKRKAKEL